MKAKVVLLAIAMVVASTVLAADYEVTIDGKTYMFTQGVERNLILNDGHRVSISVSTVKTKEFRKYGLSFSYPSDMKIGEESFYGIKQITLKSTDSTLLMLQIFPAGTTPNKLRRDLLAGLREGFGNLGARFPAKSTESCKKSIGGVEREGIRLLYALGSIAHESEIYTMHKNGKTLAMVFQYAVEDKGKATPRYEVITSTFK